MSMNIYEIKDSSGAVVQYACTFAQSHGKVWHDSLTAGLRIDTATDASLSQWASNACMGADRLMDVCPTSVVLSDGRQIKADDYRIVEMVGNDVILHGKTANQTWDFVTPYAFVAWAGSMAQRIQNDLGINAELSSLVRLGDNGSTLVADVWLGSIDLGAGDIADYYAQITTGYGTAPTSIKLTMTRRVCQNTENASEDEAKRTGRKHVIQFSNSGGVNLRKMDDELVNTSIKAMETWIKCHAEKMKQLKGIAHKLDQKGLDALVLCGLESGVFSPKGKKDAVTGETSIPLTDDILATIQNGGKTGLALAAGDYGRLGPVLVTAIAESSAESAMIDPLSVDTAFTSYQALTRVATRRGDGVNSDGKLLAMARLFADRALA